MQASAELKAIACELALQVIALTRSLGSLPDERHFPSFRLPGEVRASWRITEKGLQVTFAADDRSIIVFVVTVNGTPGLHLTVEPQGPISLDHHHMPPDPADDERWIERLSGVQAALRAVPIADLPAPVWRRLAPVIPPKPPSRSWWRRLVG